MGKMREVAGNGRTILYVSHSLPSIAALCHHALWLDEGQVKGYGTARSIVGEYLGSVKSKSHTVLEHRTDRTGDGSMKIVAVRLTSNAPDGVICITSQLRLSIDYRADGPVRHPSVRVGIDDHGVGIFGLDSNIAGGLPEELPAQGTIECLTDPINLSPGRYFVHIVLLRAGLIADYVVDASAFDVEPTTVFSSGRLPEQGWALNVLRHSWSVPASDAVQEEEQVPAGVAVHSATNGSVQQAR